MTFSRNVTGKVSDEEMFYFCASQNYICRLKLIKIHNFSGEAKMHPKPNHSSLSIVISCVSTLLDKHSREHQEISVLRAL